MKKRFLIHLLTLCVILALFSCQPYASAYDELYAALFQPKTSLEISGMTIHFNLATGKIYDSDVNPGTKTVGLVIPSSIEGIAVTAIGKNAFSRCSRLTSVTIPNSVTTIEDYAFFRTGLTSIVIPSSVTTIGDHAFNECENLTSVTIPDSVTRIGGSAFEKCESLTSITIPDSVTELGGQAFRDCYSLSSIRLPQYIKEIEPYMFDFCYSLDNVIIPEGVTSISTAAFENCISLKTITIPKSVNNFGVAAFSNCPSLSDVYFTGTVEQWKAIPRYQGTFTTDFTVHCNSPIPSVPAPVTVPSPPSTTQTVSAVPTSSTVLVNGAKTAFDSYNIGGNNYFKLRDLAYVLSGSDKQFDISWDASANAVSLTVGQPYTAVGGELGAKGTTAQQAVTTTSKILLNGAEVSFSAFNIGGNNYFKLRDIGEAFNFGVDWDNTSKSIAIDTSKGYTPS